MSPGTYASLSRIASVHECLCFSPVFVHEGLWSSRSLGVLLKLKITAKECEERNE